MSVRHYANAPATKLAVGVDNAATSFEVESITGFPVSFPFTLIVDRGLPTEEVVEATNASGTTLTVTRGVDGTTAFSHTTGAVVEHGISARDAREANEHINASTGVHGVTGSVVGTGGSQTLSNKTLVTPTIASFVNATHNHQSTAGGGQLTDAALSSAVGVAKGGTGRTSLTSGMFLVGAGTSQVNLDKAAPNGDVVGTSDAQSLTNKDLTDGSNTFPWIIKTGNATINLSNASTGTANVTFDSPFPGTPTVSVVVDDTSIYFANVMNRSANGFTVSIRHHNDTNLTANLTVEWIAVYVRT